jgi:PAS domain S-box-containing protein
VDPAPSAPPLPPPPARPRALRLWGGLATGLAVAYMTVLALYMLVHIGPLSREMSLRSSSLADAVEELHRRSTQNQGALAAARHALASDRPGEAPSGPLPAPSIGPPSEPRLPGGLPADLSEAADLVGQAEVRLHEALRTVVDEVAAGDTVAARARLAAAEIAHDALGDALSNLQVQGLAFLASQEGLLAATALQAGRTALLWLFGGLLVLGIGGAVVHRRVGVPLLQLDHALRQVEGGDLSVELEPAGNDEVGALVRRFNHMTRELRERAREQERTRTGLASRLERFLNHAVVEVYVLDADTLRIRQVNPSAVRNLGYSPDRLVQMRPSDLLTPESVARSRTVLDDLRSGATASANLQAELVRADGSRYPAECRILYAPHDTPPSFLILAHDVSGRLEGERDLREARTVAERAMRRFRSLVENSPLGLVEWTPDLRVAGWDGEAARILGRRREEALGRTLEELGLLPPGDLERVGERLRGLLAGEGYPEAFPADVDTGGGRRRTVWYTSVVHDEEGTPEALLSLVDDVTDEARAMVELRASEERYRLLFERNPLPMWVFHRDDLRFLAVNEAAIQHYGYSRAEFLAMTVESIRPPEEVARFHALRDTSTPGLRVAGTWTHRRKDGTLIRVEIARFGFLMDGVPAVLVLAQDVTDRLAAEEEIRRSREELLRFTGYLQTVREEERTRLAREIHDELGQALTGVRMGLARVASRVHSEDLDAAAGLVRETAELVDRSIQEVRRIATQLRPGVLDQLGLLAALEWLAEDFQVRSGVEVGVTLPGIEPELPPEVQTQLFRCVQEAFTNVARHAAASRVELEVAADPDGVTVSVTDDGRGFDTASVPERSLGLVGMRERARLVGGELLLESGPGEGTRITVRLPLPGTGAGIDSDREDQP